jgi:glycosyltransferase involved in cell wall biosynthesis
MADSALFRLILFDLNPTGHHPGYLQHLIVYARERAGRVALDVVVSADFPDRHPDIVALAQVPGVTLLPITASEQRQVTEGSFLKRMQAEWSLCCAYARQRRADQILLMYVDQFQLALLTGPKAPCPVAGIYFRPTFHYPRFANYRAGSWKERLRETRKQVLLRLALWRSDFGTLFCLDPFSVDAIRPWHPATVHLPDPVEIYPHTSDEQARVRDRLAVEPGRKAALIFGLLDERKGIAPLVQALGYLTDAEQRQLALVLVGPMPEYVRTELDPLLTEAAGRYPVQLIRYHDFVPDDQIQPYFAAADFVLALYQQHVGMSAVLVRSAAAGRPVLSSDYGLMGELVTRRGLGLTTDAANPAAIADALRRMLTGGTGVARAAGMAEFAEQNRAARYAQTIFDTLIPH